MRIVAQIISTILHPVIMPTLAVFYLTWTNPFLFNNSWYLILITAINTFVFPVLATLLMRATGLIQSLELKTRNERIAVFIAVMVFYTWSVVLFYRLEGYPETIGDIAFGATAGLTFAFLNIIFDNKISLHTIGVGGLAAIALFSAHIATHRTDWAFALVIVVAGLIGSSRLILNAHTPRQVLHGYLTGFLCTAIALII